MDAVRLGRSVRILRQRRGWRQVDLSARAGVPRSAVSLLELGRAGELRLDAIERIGRALEARVIVRVDWRGEAIDRLLDSAHAALDELFDGAAVPADHLGGQVEVAAEGVANLLRVAFLGKGRETDEIGEEDGDESALCDGGERAGWRPLG